jgi:hypothetical protein
MRVVAVAQQLKKSPISSLPTIIYDVSREIKALSSGDCTFFSHLARKPRSGAGLAIIVSC